MRRYELMLVIRPDVADERQVVIDRTTRPDRRLGRPDRSLRADVASRTRSTGTARARTTSSSTPRVSPELERGLLITEEVLRIW